MRKVERIPTQSITGNRKAKDIARVSIRMPGRTAITWDPPSGIVLAASEKREANSRYCSSRLVEETAALIRAEGGIATAITADLGREDDVREMVKTAVSTFGSVDCLVNNAGDGGPTRPVQDYPMEEWLYTINSCLTSSYLCTRFAVPAMIDAGRGAIVNIASMAGRRGLAYRIGYCSAKAGQIGMTVGLAMELGRHNITVNAIAPGYIATEMNSALLENKEFTDWVSKRTPVGRWGQPGDLGGAAVFLASDAAAYVNGVLLPVDGGFTASM